MFLSLDHPQGATLFLAEVTSKTFIKFLYINRCCGRVSCCVKLCYWECAWLWCTSCAKW